MVERGRIKVFIFIFCCLFFRQEKCLQLLRMKVCNLKRQEAYGTFEGDISIIRASSFTQQLQSLVTPIKPAKPPLSGPAVDPAVPRRQIGPGEGLQSHNGAPPQLLYLKSITRPPISHDSGLGPDPLTVCPPSLQKHQI